MNDLAVTNLQGQIEYARTLAGSQMLPAQYRGKPENLLYAISYAESIGVHPMTAVTGIHVIDGKPSASAQLIGSLVRRAGHKLRVTGDDTKAVAIIIRADDPDFEFRTEWTIERAKAAGLTGKNVWKNYPAAMLKARAITEVAREACAEALFGVIYTPEELGQDGQIDDTGEFAPTQRNAPAPTYTVSPPRNWEHELHNTNNIDELRKLHHDAVTAAAPDTIVEAIIAKGKALAADTTTDTSAEVIDAEIVEDTTDTSDHNDNRKEVAA